MRNVLFSTAIFLAVHMCKSDAIGQDSCDWLITVGPEPFGLLQHDTTKSHPRWSAQAGRMPLGLQQQSVPQVMCVSSLDAACAPNQQQLKILF